MINKENCISAFSFNVLQTNRDYDRTIKLIDREDPDIVLLLETGGEPACFEEPAHPVTEFTVEPHFGNSGLNVDL